MTDYNEKPASACVDVDVLRTTGVAALVKVGVPRDAAALQMDLLLEAELRGRPSHGLLRLPRVIERISNGVANPLTMGRHEWVANTFLSVDGEAGLGPVVAMAAITEAKAITRQSGVAIIAIRNNNHLGMLAWYAEKIAEEGLISVALSTSEALVHAWNGRQAILGTNPVAIGVPTAGKPFVLDMATSLVSMGQIHDYAQRSQALPEGWALDAAGEPTRNAEAAKQGSIAPFGQAKGYALGLAFELLVVSLTASAIGTDVVGTLDSTELCNKGDVFILIDPKQGAGVAASISRYLDQVRGSGDEAGPRRVHVPGDRAHSEREENLRNGITLPPQLWARLQDLAGHAQDRID